MATVIRIVGWCDGGRSSVDGRYLRGWACDPQNPGLPVVDAVPDLADATRYPDVAAAHAAWTAVNPEHPVRPDGRPNRPMTAFTVEMITVDP